MIKGFRDFIAQGNVIDLAVAVVIGAAFTAIVNTIVEQLINPLIGLLFNTENLDSAFVLEVGSAKFGFGAIIAAVISFLAVAAVVYFVFVLPMNKYKEHQAAKNPVAEEALPTEQELLVEIRDALRAGNAR
ncbi:large conductance mechanosensitive channel protein MscL [Microbacterium soli]|uniref:Large-conductance mechanosensitive channel n=1 Tax=Microbacterium soli TaxID=446075 RepID=A0ABP7NBR7_9MICO